MHKDPHNQAMAKLKTSLQVTLNRMRKKQRNQQHEIDRKLKLEEGGEGDEKPAAEGEEGAAAEGEGDAPEGEAKEGSEKKKKSSAPLFCKPCKLVFHQKRAEHEESDMHLLIYKFLNPKCAACQTQFFSPMAYERHIASISHIKVRPF